MDPDENGVVLDNDNDLSEEDSVPHFGKTTLRDQESEESDKQSSYNDLSEMFNQARMKAHRGTVSIGGHNDFPSF